MAIVMSTKILPAIVVDVMRVLEGFYDPPHPPPPPPPLPYFTTKMTQIMKETSFDSKVVWQQPFFWFGPKVTFKYQI